MVAGLSGPDQAVVAFSAVTVGATVVGLARFDRMSCVEHSQTGDGVFAKQRSQDRLRIATAVEPPFERMVFPAASTTYGLSRTARRTPGPISCQ